MLTETEAAIADLPDSERSNVPGLMRVRSSYQARALRAREFVSGQAHRLIILPYGQIIA